MFFPLCSLLRSKEVYSRSLRKTTSSRCPIVVSPCKCTKWKDVFSNCHWWIVSVFISVFLFTDIKERFTNYTLLLIVCLRNMEQFSWNPGIQLTTDSSQSLCIRNINVCINHWSLLIDHLWVLFPDVCMVIASEIAVDVVKHAFITKFNDITADVSSNYCCTVY